MLRRSDIPLIRRAVREGWPVPAEMREHVVDDLMELMNASSARTALRVARVFLEMVESNRSIPQSDDAATQKASAVVS
jgi:hypothetical protein